MFTGLISDVGKVRALEHSGDLRLTIGTAFDMDAVAIGASIACSGVCLTVVDKGADWFAVDVSAESLAKTTLGDWQEGRAINLERSLTVGDEIGGHLVSGHVDGVIEVLSRKPSGDSVVLAFVLPEWLAPYVAPKGSIALDGISLTVNWVMADCFEVNIIFYTQEVTTFGALAVGDLVNVEIDMQARYARRALAHAGVAT